MAKKRANFLAIFKQKIELSVYFFTQTDSTRTVQSSALCRSRRALSIHILWQNLASIQPLTSPFKFARSPRTDRLIITDRLPRPGRRCLLLRTAEHIAELADNVAEFKSYGFLTLVSWVLIHTRQHRSPSPVVRCAGRFRVLRVRGGHRGGHWLLARPPPLPRAPAKL